MDDNGRDDDDDDDDDDRMMSSHNMADQYDVQYGNADITQQMDGHNMRMVEIDGKLHLVPVDGSLWLNDVREVSRWLAVA